MGDPKKPSNKFRRPRNPWRADQLTQELYLVGNYGLRNKRELWRAQTELSNIRKQARTLLAASQEIREREESKLLRSLYRRGLVRDDATLDDILSLTIEDFLSRRLQTMVFKKGFAKSPLHARQLIVHGHVMVGDRIVRVPSYMVSRDEEERIVVTLTPKEKPEEKQQEATMEVTQSG